jgi:exo-1,4-beta-D-glucosaminidase
MMQYDGERAMFEAYSGQRYTSTGVVQWMLNNAWPSLIWHLYDYYLVPGAGYYGAKKANQPIHLQYNYDNHSIYIVNSTLNSSGPLAVTAELFDPALHRKFSKSMEIVAEPNSSHQILTIPEEALNDESQVHFLRLSIGHGSSDTSTNFYWIPSKLTDFDWAKSDYNFTPASTHEVMTDLRSLPEAVVHSTLIRKQDNLSLTLENTSKTLAFGVNAQVLDQTGHEAPMVLWDDNFIELMPGERRVLIASLAAESTNPHTVRIIGWNVPAVQHIIPRAETHK